MSKHNEDKDDVEAFEKHKFESRWESLANRFAFNHLVEPQRSVARSYAKFATQLIDALPPDSERTIALRKLLESRDAAYRVLETT